MDIRRVEQREFIHILVIFLSAQFMGLFLAAQLFSGLTYQQVQSVQAAANLQGGVEYAVYLIALVIGFSLVMILIFKKYRSAKFLYVLEAIVIFSAGFFVFAVLISTLFTYLSLPNTAFYQDVLLVGTVALSAAMITIKNLLPRTRNYVTIVVAAGVGLIWGYNFSFSTTYIIFIAFAVYDIVAVFITKHMVVMANAMMDKNLTFLVKVGDLQALPEAQASGNKGYIKEMDRLARSDTMYRDIRRSGMVPVPVGNALGTGDIILPLALAVSAYTVSLNFVLSFFVIFGALLGFVTLFYLLKKMRRVLPALPSLLFGCSMGIMAYYLLYVVL